jgi:hypothetical protein
MLNDQDGREADLAGNVQFGGVPLIHLWYKRLRA